MTQRETTIRQTLLPYKWELIVLLWFAFFLNQADRQIYNVVLPLIKADLRLTDVQLGLVASAFIWCLGLLVPFAGYAGDVLRRKWIIVLSLLLWSAATLFTGAIRHCWQGCGLCWQCWMFCNITKLMSLDKYVLRLLSPILSGI